MPNGNYLLKTLEEITEKLVNYPIKGSLYDDTNTNILCSCIEGLFLHSQSDATFTKITRFIRQTSQKQPDDFDFWIFIKHYLPRTLIATIEKSSIKRTSIGCCRVWVRLALNEATLLSYIEAVLHDSSRIYQYYETDAILRQKELLDRVKSCLHRVSQLPFHLNLTCPSLNKWSQSIALQLAKVDCVIIEEYSRDTDAIIVDLSTPAEVPKTQTLGDSAYSLIDNLSGPLRRSFTVQPTVPSSPPDNKEAKDDSSNLQTFVSPLLSHFVSLKPQNENRSRRHTFNPCHNDSEKLVERESRLIKFTEEQLNKEICKLRSESFYKLSPPPDDKAASQGRDEVFSDSLPAGCNSLVFQHSESWWETAPTDTTQTDGLARSAASVGSDNVDGGPTYSELIIQNQVSPGTKDSFIDSGLHDGYSLDDSENIKIGAPCRNAGCDDRESRTECDGWDMLADEIVKPSNMPNHLLDLYPGVTLADKAPNSESTFNCNYCQVKLKARYANLDYYDGKYYCGMCHVKDKCIIPRDVINNWDFTPKQVSTMTKRFLSELISHPNIHIGQRNASLYDTVPVLARLKYLRRQLSMFWYQLTLCSAKVSKQLRCSIFPREYMLGSLREVDLYSLEDLIIARSGVLEHQLQYAIDRIALPHVKSCRHCQEQAVVCDICRCPTKIIQLYEIDTYRRCCTLNCCKLMHIVCINSRENSPVYCRHCRTHFNQLDDRPPSLRDYDAIFPN